MTKKLRRRRFTQNTLRLERPPDFEQPPHDQLMLTVLAGPNPGAVQLVTGHEIILGRSATLTFSIEDRGVSGRHARIFRLGSSFRIEDLGSTNGTFVNGSSLTTSRELKDGDRIQLGESTLLHISLQDAAHAEAQQRMYDSAHFDGLTGMYNRAQFDQMLEREFAFAERHKTPLTVLFIDLDHFSEVNNTHGHQAGDAVLRATAQAIEEAVRSEDIVARYGGEEFVLLARGITANNAMQLAQRVRRTIAGQVTSHDGKELSVTASIGVACRDARTRYENALQLVAAADRAVYRAKAEGRNRCCHAVMTPAAP